MKPESFLRCVKMMLIQNSCLYYCIPWRQQGCSLPMLVVSGLFWVLWDAVISWVWVKPHCAHTQNVTFYLTVVLSSLKIQIRDVCKALVRSSDVELLWKLCFLLSYLFSLTTLCFNVILMPVQCPVGDDTEMCFHHCPVAGSSSGYLDNLVESRQKKSASLFSEMLSTCKSVVPFIPL